MQDVLLGYGPLGVAVIALGVAVLTLYRRNESIQDQRLQDARETRDKLSGPLDELAKQSKATYELLVDVLSKRGK